MMVHARKVSLNDLADSSEEREYWSSKTIEEKIEAVELLRNHFRKIKGTKRSNGNFKGLRRVLRIAKLK